MLLECVTYDGYRSDPRYTCRNIIHHTKGLCEKTHAEWLVCSSYLLLGVFMCLELGSVAHQPRFV